jgi:hypothetical protein
VVEGTYLYIYEKAKLYHEMYFRIFVCCTLSRTYCGGGKDDYTNEEGNLLVYSITIIKPANSFHSSEVVSIVTMQPYMNEEWETLPHVIWTPDMEWDPTVLDHAIIDANDDWFDTITDLETKPFSNLIDENGNLGGRLLLS